MNYPTPFWLRVFSIMGILGGLSLFTGDMLLYYNGNNENLLENMAQVSDQRIILSGITALLSTWLYLFGIFPVYYAFAKTSGRVKNTVLLTFAGILIAYGVVHGAFIAIATDAKLAYRHGLDLNDSIGLARRTNDMLRLFIYPLFAVLSFMFFYNVLKNKTLYPKWILVFFPLLPFLLQDFIVKNLSGKYLVIINGGFYNLILIVFFTASALALWNKYTSVKKL
jgi:hypothetical protein